VNDKRVPGADSRCKVIAELGRHVLSLVRVSKFAAAHTRKPHVMKNLSHIGMRLERKALVGGIERLE
jgi:hypothetical protein